MRVRDVRNAIQKCNVILCISSSKSPTETQTDSSGPLRSLLRRHAASTDGAYTREFIFLITVVKLDALS